MHIHEIFHTVWYIGGLSRRDCHAWHQALHYEEEWLQFQFQKFEGLADSTEFLNVWEMKTTFCISKITWLLGCIHFSSFAAILKEITHFWHSFSNCHSVAKSHKYLVKVRKFPIILMTLYILWCRQLEWGGGRWGSRDCYNDMAEIE